MNAFYSKTDNTIRKVIKSFYSLASNIFLEFPAAILQAPNFDRNRPFCLNFGAIGSVIGHEITHAFDNQASNNKNWSETSNKAYMDKVECFVNQYSNYSVTDDEENFVKTNTKQTFNLKGSLTKREDIADNGGVKLSFNAFQKYVKNHQDPLLVGMKNFTPEQLFFLSYAQTFCRFAFRGVFFLSYNFSF